MLSELYARVAARRRRWYERHPDARRRLSRPVVSVGALAAGGRGKTPVAALVAGMLRDAGERPAILSRGYGRRVRADGVVVVSDAERVRAGVETAGDEPRMLAERLAGVPVLVGDDRYLAGRLAETRLGATVHVLDDGFQHLPLARDLDLLLVSPHDVDGRTLPLGRLRERPGTARLADALIVDGRDAGESAAVAERFGVATSFLLRRTLGVPRLVGNGRPPEGDAPAVAGTAAAAGAGVEGRVPAVAGIAAPAESAGAGVGERVLAVAGIAEPARFADALAAAGFDVAGMLAFADHHRFTAADVRRIAARASALRAPLVLTTEKDAVRLAPRLVPHGGPPERPDAESRVAPAEPVAAGVPPTPAPPQAAVPPQAAAPPGGAPIAATPLAGVPIAAVPLHVAVEPADEFRTWLLHRVTAAGGRR